MKSYYILTFQNTHWAINGESVLKKENIKAEVMPTPTFITKSCGICIKINIDYIEQIKTLIKEGSIVIKNVYLRDENNYKIFQI